MGDLTLPPRSSEEWRRVRSDAIERFVRDFAPGENADLMSDMLVTISRLSSDGVDRGDLKLLNTALRELRYAFKVFSPYREVRKVSIFGSARTREDHPQYLQAHAFAERIQDEGWMVITGAGGGIMHAGHKGASREASFGVAISLPFEQETNDVIANDPKLVSFKYFFTRKLVFVKETNAIALFPGGFGTQDEGFESITLVQTVKTAPKPIVLVDEPGGTYWTTWREYVRSQLLGNRMIDPEDLNLFRVTDNAEEAVAEILRFYRRYHSSRFVGDKMVMRLNAPLSDPVLSELNERFLDILIGGRFEQLHGPLDGEDDAYPDKPRLVFAFDRRSAGKLRLLINRINEG